MDKYADKKNWDKWIELEVIKHSGKPFYSGLKTGVVKELTLNIHSGKPGFLMDDGKIVDCHQCKLKE